MRKVKVTYSNGQEITTRCNGTDDQLKQYFYIGCVVNLGSVVDNMQTITKLDILE